MKDIYKRNILYLVLLLCALSKVSAEAKADMQGFAVGVKFLCFNSHLGTAINQHIIPLKLDPNANLVYNPGGTLNAEVFLLKNILSIKFVQGLCADCAMQFLGYTHLGFRLRLLKIKRFSLNFGIGPTFIYRQSWYKIKGYDDTGRFFRGSPEEDWEYRFIWWGGEGEININVKDGWDVSVSVVPSNPLIINMGFRYRFGNFKRTPKQAASPED